MEALIAESMKKKITELEVSLQKAKEEAAKRFDVDDNQ